MGSKSWTLDLPPYTIGGGQLLVVFLDTYMDQFLHQIKTWKCIFPWKNSVQQLITTFMWEKDGSQISQFHTDFFPVSRCLFPFPPLTLISTFSLYLVTVDGDVHGVWGSSPALEEKISTKLHFIILIHYNINHECVKNLWAFV